MNTTVATAIAAELVELERVADSPTEALGYGSDLSCVADCEATFLELPSDSPRVVAQSIARRFMTPRGAVLDAPDYGYDLRGMCNRGVPAEELRALHSRMHAEATKDERVDSANIALEVDGRTVRARVELTLRGSSEAFRFVVAVDAALAALEGA